MDKFGPATWWACLPPRECDVRRHPWSESLVHQSPSSKALAGISRVITTESGAALRDRIKVEVEETGKLTQKRQVARARRSIIGRLIAPAPGYIYTGWPAESTQHCNFWNHLYSFFTPYVSGHRCQVDRVVTIPVATYQPLPSEQRLLQNLLESTVDWAARVDSLVEINRLLRALSNALGGEFEFLQDC